MDEIANNVLSFLTINDQLEKSLQGTYRKYHILWQYLYTESNNSIIPYHLIPTQYFFTTEFLCSTLLLPLSCDLNEFLKGVVVVNLYKVVSVKLYTYVWYR